MVGGLGFLPGFFLFLTLSPLAFSIPKSHSWSKCWNENRLCGGCGGSLEEEVDIVCLVKKGERIQIKKSVLNRECSETFIIVTIPKQ